MSYDRVIKWKAKRIFIPVHLMAGIDNNGSDNISLSQGTPSVVPATTAEVVAMPMTTADEVCHIMPIPWDLDRNKKVLGRIWFLHAAAAADGSISWKCGVKFFGKQDAITEFVAGADKTVTFGAHTTGTGNQSIEITDWNDLNWDSYLASTDVLAGLHVELDSDGDAAGDECKLLGLELMYEVNALDSRRQTTDNMLLEQPL
jgi:hypothetical protein